MSKETAVFGGGCFWGMEKFFRKGHPELLSVSVGYMGGKLDDPSYEVRKGSAKVPARDLPRLRAL
jgi:peptide-methionine (S)-S-oxide reductase